jgi:integrase/recombinase XerD
MAKTQRDTRNNRKTNLLAQFPHIQQPTNAQSLYGLAQAYVMWLREHNYSELTLEGRELHLCELVDWCGQRQLCYPTQISKPILDRYQRTLFYKRKANGEPLAFSTQAYRLAAIRMWFKWLMQQDYIASNPASELQMPRVEKRLPKSILTEREIETILHQPDIHDCLGLRDRAMLEVLYSTGIRRTELANLKITDIDTTEGTLMVRQGKGKKDRFIPLGERASAWVEKYLYEARGELSCARDNHELFLSAHGLAFHSGNVSILARKYIEQAGIHKVGACHLFRHAMATHMLENGADLRFIQAMLGHSDIKATEVYTQVSIKKLKAIHAQTHPAAGLVKKEKAKDVAFVSVEQSEEMLLSLLAADFDEEPSTH